MVFAAARAVDGSATLAARLDVCGLGLRINHCLFCWRHSPAQTTFRMYDHDLPAFSTNLGKQLVVTSSETRKWEICRCMSGCRAESSLRLYPFPAPHIGELDLIKWGAVAIDSCRNWVAGSSGVAESSQRARTPHTGPSTTSGHAALGPGG